jgi:hypothetical protein
VPTDITKSDALLLCASLHKYLQHIADAHSGNPDYVARARRDLGALIWSLDDAAAWPRPVAGHSKDAVRPDQ